MGVELMYFDGCPHGESYLPHLRRLVSSAQLGAEVEVRRIASDEEAQTARFLGSPSVHVDGHDVDPGAVERSDYTMTCRLYRTDEGTSGTPPDEWVLRALSSTA